MGKQGLLPFSPSRVQITVEGNMRLFAVHVRTLFLCSNIEMRFLLGGEGCDTLSVIYNFILV
jgi:hypothetical protein